MSIIYIQIYIMDLGLGFMWLGFGTVWTWCLFALWSSAIEVGWIEFDNWTGFQISIGNTLEIVDRFSRRPLGGQIFRYDASNREFTIHDYSRTVQGSGYYWSLPRQFLGNKVCIGFEFSQALEKKTQLLYTKFSVIAWFHDRAWIDDLFLLK